ncbi:MAG: transposase [Acidobacteria bacterium]|nr:transposase [Acidobacteriota bacterium]
MDRLLDEARFGPTYLKQPAIAQLVLASMEYGAAAGHYQLHSWVIMPNHVHLLLTPQVAVSKLLGSLKAATARRANLLLQPSGHCQTSQPAASADRQGLLAGRELRPCSP